MRKGQNLVKVSIPQLFKLIQNVPLSGDEGSGLYLKPDNKTTDKRFVVGIASFRSDCESPAPAVYTKVSLYLDWIENIVWP